MCPKPVVTGLVLSSIVFATTTAPAQVAAIEATPTFFGSRGELEDLASAGVFERHPLERTVRRAPANERSTRSVVRRCLQCSTGKS